MRVSKKTPKNQRNATLDVHELSLAEKPSDELTINSHLGTHVRERRKSRDILGVYDVHNARKFRSAVEAISTGVLFAVSSTVLRKLLARATSEKCKPRSRLIRL